MNTFKVLLLSLACMLCVQQHTFAQVDFFLNGRTTNFQGVFGNYYEGLGLEAGLTIKSDSSIFAGGLHYQRSWLGSLPSLAHTPKLNVIMNSYIFHYGGKATVGRIFHPFAYAAIGIRTIDFIDPALHHEDGPFFSSLTPTIGARAGLQVGGKRWRVEGSLSYLTGSNARYLTPETIESAQASGSSYRELAKKSPVSNLSFGLGIVYVMHWEELANKINY